MLRAILEGIACEVHLQSSGVEAATSEHVREWVVMGGGSRSDLWCQIIADVTGREVRRAAEREAAALGAAMLAAVGAGAFPSLTHAARDMVRTTGETGFQPDERRHAVYMDLYHRVYRPLYPALREIMHKLPG
jgi:xylulokinase